MDSIRKNLLDLQYTTYMQYFNTAIVVLCTYIVGVAIAIITQQTKQFMLIGIISLGVFGILVTFLIYCKEKMKQAISDINSLSQSIKIPL